MLVHQSSWGFHPIDYRTFTMLKELHKNYWETVRMVARWIRWNRKTVRRYGPEPRYCPIFVKEEGHIETFRTRDGYTGTRWLPKTLVDHGIVAAYRAARRPAATPDEVAPISLTPEEIERLYREVEAWKQQEGQPCRSA
jgi:hypothetical protein